MTDRAFDPFSPLSDPSELDMSAYESFVENSGDNIKMSASQVRDDSSKNITQTSQQPVTKAVSNLRKKPPG
jgi:hypothetical protein